MACLFVSPRGSTDPTVSLCAGVQLRLALCELMHAIVDRATSVGAGALLMPYYHNFISASFVRTLSPVSLCVCVCLCFGRLHCG